MSIGEEYLDNLLNSVKDSSEQAADTESQKEELQEKTIIADIEPESEKEEEAEEEAKEASDDTGDESWKTSLDELLAAADTVAEESLQQESQNDEDFDKLVSAVGDAPMEFASAAESVSSDMDVTQMIDNMGGSDDDLAAIRDLLVKSDNNEMITGDLTVTSGSMEEEEPVPDTGKKKKSKSFFSFLKKGKKKKADKKKDSAEEWDSVLEEESTAADEEAAMEESGMEEPAMAEPGMEEPAVEEAVMEEPVIEEPAMAEPAMEELSDEGAPEEPQNIPVKKEKGQSKGFLDTFFEAIFGEDEETGQKESLDENGEILKELELEDQKKAEAKKNEKEKKKKEKADKKKAKAGAKKEKKPKPEKVKKKPEEPVRTPGKPINPKFIFVLIAFCATIIAAVNLLSIFLTDYADKQNARTAFYAGRYEDVYLLLYNRTLNQEETILYNRANTVLQLQRRLDSYHSNKKIGMDAEALDSLLLGVSRYGELMGSETYGANDELNALYQEILNCLSTDYGVSEEMALEMNTYGREAYTQRIYGLINGTDFMQEPSESAEPEFTEPQDILPDEEDIINIEP